MDKLNLAHEIKSLKRSIDLLIKQQGMTHSFFRGVVTGLGSAIGATLVVGILALILRNVQLIPVIGDWVAQIADYVQSSSGR